MNRVNPIYLALLLLLIIAFVSFKLSDAKSELKEARDDYKTTLKLSTDLSALKSVYADKAKTKGLLEKILKQPALASSNIVKNFKNTNASISSDSIEINALNLLMSNILNSSLNITTLNIKKLSDTHVTLDMEITW